MRKIVGVFVVGTMFLAGAAAPGPARAEEVDVRHESEKRGEISGPIGKGVYSKPVWRKLGRGAYVGGYFDVEYKKQEGANGTFDQHRLVPFIYADIAEGVRFATEIEFEHGGTNNSGEDGEIKVEFAVLDYDIVSEKLTARAGIILTPLGKFNLTHDSPLRDLTDRPLVNRYIIPTTLSESGAGLLGTVYPTENQKIDYELYVVNGFNGDKVSSMNVNDPLTNIVSEVESTTTGGNITSSNGLRDARGSQRSDNNNNKAIAGRLAFSPLLGYELGFSGHHGAYDAAGNNDLTIAALDAAAQFGPLELLGECADARIGRDSTVPASTPERMQGYFIQANFHFLQDAVRNGSTFTAVLRQESIDLDGENKGHDMQRTTFGLNFRPIEDMVFKLDYQINKEDPRKDNDQFLASVASYF